MKTLVWKTNNAIILRATLTLWFSQNILKFRLFWKYVKKIVSFFHAIRIGNGFKAEKNDINKHYKMVFNKHTLSDIWHASAKLT